MFNTIFFNGKLDAYCTSCKKERTFGRADLDYPNRHIGYMPLPIKSYSEFKNEYPGSFYFNAAKTFNLYFECAHDKEHVLTVNLLFYKNELHKTGQFPSIADIASPHIEKYRQLLGKEKFNEFSKGIGLASHGVGIGSHVYLRRIFEQLVEEAHIEATNQTGWDELAYEKSRMAEKIGLLQNYLPTFLVENRVVYSILSKAVHELKEDECKTIFPVMLNSIEIMLDEKNEAMVRNKKAAAARLSISQIMKELNKP